MSFSVTVPAVTVADLPQAIDNAIANYEKVLAGNDSQPTDETLELIAAGRKAALTIAEELHAEKVTVAIAGHANPDHKPIKGWANDSVTVAVYSVDPQPTE